MDELSYDIQTSMGFRCVEGTAVSEFIAVREDKARDEWVVDHIKTGLRIVGVKTEVAARNVAESIAGALDWGQMTGTDGVELPKELRSYISSASGQHRVQKFGGQWSKPPNERFTIDVSGTFTLNVRQLWPDGNWPDEPKVEDVEKLIEREGGPACVIAEWNLDPKINVSVSRPR